MTVKVQKFSPEAWYKYAEDAHKLVFKKQREPWLDRISFALLAINRDEAIGYVTCREFDGESLYWQYGGAFDEFKGIAAVRGFQAFYDYTRHLYKRCTTLVENSNVGYLHLLMKMGFRVIGIRNYKGEIFLELLVEFDHAV